jgi:tRNA-dihydrouridine synthase A
MTQPADLQNTSQDTAENMPKEISVAPMMDRTDRHCRYFHRLLAPDIRLYTEMVVDKAVIHGDKQLLLGFDPAESPLALQLGGNDPDLLVKAAITGEQWGYDEINLNIGCPSDRVQSGRFGACLMAEPQTVAACVHAISSAVDIPVTVKTRIGIDDHNEYSFLTDFIATVAEAGCSIFVVHARKAILAGLSPKENRSIPPLRYEVVYRLKQDFPQLRIIINGGVRSAAEAADHLQKVDGVMIGRQAYSDPYSLTQMQGVLCGLSAAGEEWEAPTREKIVTQMAEYAGRMLNDRTRLQHISRHMLGLYAGQPGARAWRRFISEGVANHAAGPELLLQSIEK